MHPFGKDSWWRQKKRNSKVFAYFQAYYNNKLERCGTRSLKLFQYNFAIFIPFGNIAYSKSEFKCYDNFIKVAIFGTLYENFPYDILLKNLHDISRIKKRNYRLGS